MIDVQDDLEIEIVQGMILLGWMIDIPRLKSSEPWPMFPPLVQ